VLDTNIFISAYFYGGIPKKVVDEWIKGNSFVLVVSPFLVSEVIIVFDRFNLSKEKISDLKELFEKKSSRIFPTESTNICRDPKDNQILNLCVAGSADFLVTGDKDLLILKKFKKTVILDPKKFLKVLKSKL
jgi:putative PIN family toxin of toxin-antitoxin system